MDFLHIRFGGSALLNLNAKHESRNPKQYRMTKIQMIQTIGVVDIANIILFMSLGHLVFEFVSNFDIRILNFADGICRKHDLRA